MSALGDYAQSKKLVELKTRQVLGEDIKSESEMYITSLIRTGLLGAGYYSSYCSYISALGITYVEDNVYMEVRRSTETGKLTFVINAPKVIAGVDTEFDIYFMMSHEALHLIYRHFQKYDSLLHDDVTSLFINLATDVEVNNTLKTEIATMSRSGLVYGISGSYDPVKELKDTPAAHLVKDKFEDNIFVPRSAFMLEEFADIINSSEYVLNSDYKYTKSQRKSQGGTYSLADFLYDSINNYCDKVLGLSIPEILYRAKLLKKTSFVKEIELTANGEKSEVFEIPEYYEKEAEVFCQKLMKYLKDHTRSSRREIIGVRSEKSEGGKPEEKESSESKGTKSGDIEPEDEWLDEEDSKRKRSDKKTAPDENPDRESLFDKLIHIGELSTDELDAIDELAKSIKSESSGNIRLKGTPGTSSGGKGEVKFQKTRSIVTWQNVLKRTLYAMQEKKPTKNRLNRRQPDRLDLSGRINQKGIELVIGIDESSSISDLEYNYFLSEILEITKQFSCSLHLYEFTAQIEAYNYYNSHKVKQLSRININGGVINRYEGGTSFQPYFTEAYNNKKISRDSFYIIFTDGYGESSVDFKNITNRMWVVVNNNQVSCESDKSKIYSILPKAER